MSRRNVLERLQEANPEAEIWWDSSPLVYRSWTRRTVASAPPEKQELWREQLSALFDADNPAATFFRGVTTNPPLTLSAIADDPRRWTAFVRDLIDANPGRGPEEIFWLTYKEVVKRGAELFRPLWEHSNHRYGYLSAQVDPRDHRDEERMLEQAHELAAIGPNVMVKVPGTREGYRVIESLTADGIATNNTLSFTVPQYVACMNAVTRGLKRASERGVSLARWRSVITHMSARYGALGDLASQAEARQVQLTEADIRWAELAIFKRAYRLLEAAGHPSKLLMCSMRLGPATDGGTMASWHIEKIAGGDVVYTCPPKYIAELMQVEDRLEPFDPSAIDAPPPKETMDKLYRLPYFLQAYEPDGMSEAEFCTQAALLETVTEFCRATRAGVDFVARQLGSGVETTCPR